MGMCPVFAHISTVESMCNMQNYLFFHSVLNRFEIAFVHLIILYFMG